MSPSEALWFSKALGDRTVAELSPMLNLGSSTLEYRTVTCPHIDQLLFSPLAEKGVRVIHSDLKANPGVDIVGDILSFDIRKQLITFAIKSIFCNNLLEHVEDIGAVCRALSEICPHNGLLYLSVPHAYPYHPDPIDNGFRPSISELETLLQPYGFYLTESDIVDFGSYTETLKSKHWLILRDLYMFLFGIFNKKKRRVLFENYRYLYKRYQVTCALFVMNRP